MSSGANFLGVAQKQGCDPQNVWQGEQVWLWWKTPMFLSAYLCCSTAEPVANQMESSSETASCGLSVMLPFTEKLNELTLTYLEMW